MLCALAERNWFRSLPLIVYLQCISIYTMYAYDHLYYLENGSCSIESIVVMHDRLNMRFSLSPRINSFTIDRLTASFL